MASAPPIAQSPKRRQFPHRIWHTTGSRNPRLREYTAMHAQNAWKTFAHDRVRKKTWLTMLQMMTAGTNQKKKLWYNSAAVNPSQMTCGEFQVPLMVVSPMYVTPRSIASM